MSEPTVIIDAGPLVAWFDRTDAHHEWAKQTLSDLPVPFLTSEAVLTEALYLLQRYKLPVGSIFSLLKDESLVIPFDLQAEHQHIEKLMMKFRRMRKGGAMSLADASLVRLSELYANAAVITLDGHFLEYRKNGRQQIPLIIPDAVR